ncbi:MAG: hypothetical protein HN525_04290 [Candidatus Marinimicrobia bacterium]|jgi:hypothetical protein|nr:hypothetical protein [Candidatus Neomarinimicrobiota bacterium]
MKQESDLNFISRITEWFSNLNNLQKKYAQLAGIAMFLIIVYPPWKATAPNGLSTAVGHFFIFSTTPSELYKYANLDVTRLLFELVAIVIGILLVLSFVGKKTDRVHSAVEIESKETSSQEKS